MFGSKEKNAPDFRFRKKSQIFVNKNDNIYVVVCKSISYEYLSTSKKSTYNISNKWEIIS